MPELLRLWRDLGNRLTELGVLAVDQEQMLWTLWKSLLAHRWVGVRGQPLDPVPPNTQPDASIVTTRAEPLTAFEPSLSDTHVGEFTAAIASRLRERIRVATAGTSTDASIDAEEGWETLRACWSSNLMAGVGFERPVAIATLGEESPNHRGDT